MTDLEILTKLIEKTQSGEIVWKRVLKSTNDPKLSVSYSCAFVPGEILEVLPTRYADSYSMQAKYSFKLNFRDNTGFCYKSIAPVVSNPEYDQIALLYRTIETITADLDNKLKEFFGI